MNDNKHRVGKRKEEIISNGNVSEGEMKADRGRQDQNEKVIDVCVFHLRAKKQL